MNCVLKLAVDVLVRRECVSQEDSICSFAKLFRSILWTYLPAMSVASRMRLCHFGLERECLKFLHYCNAIFVVTCEYFDTPRPMSFTHILYDILLTPCYETMRYHGGWRTGGCAVAYRIATPMP